MHYYIDGYNLLFSYQDDEGESSLQDLREHILEEINTKAALLDLSITIVFDAGTAPSSHRYQHDAIEVAFSDDKTDADSWIIEHVELLRHPATCTVVTNDRRLARACRDIGAKSQSTSGWIRWLNKTTVKRGNTTVVGKQLSKIKNTLQPSVQTTSNLTKKVKTEIVKQEDPSDPTFLNRRPEENEMDRWLRIFETRSHKKK